MRRFLFLALAVLLVAWGPAIRAADDDPALASGEAWLELIDSGAYAESWKQASPMFQSRIEEPAWEEQVKAARSPLGLLKSRNLKSVRHTDALPRAPAADYTVIQFQSEFENKSQAIETLTLVRQDDRWEAAGYFIR